MKVSIAMITYNHEKYLGRAIESVLKQKVNFDYEIIIGEDCSVDNTQKVLNNYYKKHPGIIKPIIRKKNVGIINNLKEVYDNCIGEYIAILDGDDYWTDENKLQISIDFLEENKDFIATFHDVNIVDKYDKLIIGKTPYCKYKGNYNKPNDMFKYNNIPTLSLVYRNVLNKKTRNILFKNIKIVADYPLKLYLLNHGKIKYFNKKMGNYRWVRETGSSFSSMGANGRIQGLLDLLEGLKNIKELDNEYSKYYSVRIIEQKALIILAYWRYGKFKKANNFLKNDEESKFRIILFIFLIPFKRIYKKLFL